MLGGPGARRAHGGEPSAVAGDRRIRRIEPRQDFAQDAGRAVAFRQPEKRPRAFAETVDQARLRQQLEMARDARLRLPQNLGKVSDGQFRLGEQREDTQPGRLARRFEGRIERGKGKLACRGHEKWDKSRFVPNSYNDIFISFDGGQYKGLAGSFPARPV